MHAWTGMSTRQYKNLKGLKKDNLCDNMSDLELVTDIVADAAALPGRNKEEDKNESRQDTMYISEFDRQTERYLKGE